MIDNVSPKIEDKFPLLISSINNAYSFSEGLSCVKDENDKWGYIDKTGNVVIPCKWKQAYSFKKDGKDEVEEFNGQKYKINKQGEIVK